jgi:hypothetical protein
MPFHKPVMLVLGCQKHRVYLEAAVRRFAHPLVEVVGCVGDPTAPTAVYDVSAGIVTLPVPDTYQDLPKKVWAALTWCKDTWPNTPGIFKTDDDISVNKKQLIESILRNITQPYWGFVPHSVQAALVHPIRLQMHNLTECAGVTHQSAVYCYGHGYWVSAEGLAAVRAGREDYWNSFLEDVCTGFVLNRAGMYPMQCPIPYKELPRGPELLSL